MRLGTEDLIPDDVEVEVGFIADKHENDGALSQRMNDDITVSGHADIKVMDPHGQSIQQNEQQNDESFDSEKFSQAIDAYSKNSAAASN